MGADTYVGKDVLHIGYGLLLDPDISWDKLPYSTQKNIRKGKRAGFDIIRVEGTEEEMSLLRTAWYYPDDPNFPTRLGPDDVAYLAYLKGEFAGGVVLLGVGNHYFLNNLTANNIGKEHQLQSTLLWHCVEELSSGERTYIDVGVSYRPNLNRFFKQWGTLSYPVIFNPPEIGRPISFYPYQHHITTPVTDDPEDGLQALKKYWEGDDFTFFPSRIWAEKALNELGLEWVDATLSFGTERATPLSLYELPLLFPVQHGTLVRGISINDKEMWNRFGCMDFVKRAALFSRLSAFLSSADESKQIRREHHGYLKQCFELDGLEIQPPDSPWIGSFTFLSEWNEAYARRLQVFGIQKKYEPDTMLLSLPCHQYLVNCHLDYMYAVFRGVLNLCSEWVPTGVRGELKEEE